MIENVADIQILKCQQVQHHPPSTIEVLILKENKLIKVSMIENMRDNTKLAIVHQGTY